MALPAWPIASFMPVPDSFQPIQRMLDPISTDMEGGAKLDSAGLPPRAQVV